MHAPAGGRGRGDQVVLEVLRRVVRAPEHVEHLVRDNEAAGQVDEGEADSGGRQVLRDGGGHHAAAELQQRFVALLDLLLLVRRGIVFLRHKL